MLDHHAAHMAIRAHALPALPAARAWDNVRFTPQTGVPFVEEDYLPGPATLIGLVRGGTVVHEPMYVIRWFVAADTGTKALRDGVSALLARFLPGATIPMADGTVIRVRGDSAPSASGITNPEPGWAMSTITIPLRAYTLNPTT